MLYPGTKKCLTFWILEVSGLGPRKYCVYSKPISTKCQRHKLRYHCYADDTEIDVAITPNETWVDTSSKLETCLADIGAWMSGNIFMLNQGEE